MRTKALALVSTAPSSKAYLLEFLAPRTMRKSPPSKRSWARGSLRVMRKFQIWAAFSVKNAAASAAGRASPIARRANE